MLIIPTNALRLPIADSQVLIESGYSNKNESNYKVKSVTKRSFESIAGSLLLRPNYHARKMAGNFYECPSRKGNGDIKTRISRLSQCNGFLSHSILIHDWTCRENRRRETNRLVADKRCNASLRPRISDIF